MTREPPPSKANKKRGSGKIALLLTAVVISIFVYMTVIRSGKTEPETSQEKLVTITKKISPEKNVTPVVELAVPQSLVAKLQRCPSVTKKMEFTPLPQFPIQERSWGKTFYDRHPVLRHPDGGNSARYGQDLLKKYTPAQLAAMVPRQVPGLNYTICAECKIEEDRTWDWNPESPDQITCHHCQTVYPNNNYPMDQKRTYLNPFGEKIEISFHEGEGDEEHFFDSLIDKEKDAFLRRSLIHLAYAFHEKGDKKAGEAGAAILEGYAKSIPHWLTYGNLGGYGGGRKNHGYSSTGGPYLRNGKYQPYDMGHGPYPYGWYEGRGPYFSWWFRSITSELYTAYDLLYKSKYFDKKKSPDGKTSFRFWVENSIFDNQAEFMLSFPWSGHIKNNLPVHVGDLTKIAMVCGRPEYARFARDWCTLVFYNYMNHHDMVTLEGPGYHNCWMSHARGIYETLGQYNDPPGYKDEQGISLTGFDPREAPAKRRQFWGASMMHFPDGSSYPIGDSGRFAGGKGIMAKPLSRSINRIAPGFGLTTLGDGTLKNGNQVQAILSSNAGGHSHSHEDVHNLILFGNGRELFSDMYAGWSARMTSMHNTVSIDGINTSKKSGPAGSLELYTPHQPGVALVRVEAKMAAYPENSDRYRRTLVHNTVNLKHPYVLDIFEVKGGSKHDYYLQGSSEKAYPQKGSTNLRLKKFSKPAPKNPQAITGWDGFENLNAAMMNQNGYIDFRFEDNKQLGTRTHFQKEPDLMLILGEAPNMMYRTNGGYSKTLRKHMPEYKTVPKLILRHEGEKGLSTTYVLVHEILNGPSVIKGIRHQVSAEGVLSVGVDFGERRDYYAIALNKPGKLKSGPLTADGLFAAAVTKGDKCDLWTAGATQAECLGRTITDENAVWNGDVEKVVRMEDGAPRDAYLTDAQLPAGDTLKNEMVMLEFFDDSGKWLFNLSSEIDAVLTDGDKRWVTIKQDAGLIKHEDGTWEEIFHPKRMAASCKLKIISSATTVPQLAWTPNRGRYDHFDTNGYIAAGKSTKLNVTTVDPKVPIRISGDLSAQGKGHVELNVDREVRLVIQAGNSQGVMIPRAEDLHIVTQLKALGADTSVLKPGIAWKHYSGRADLQEAESLKLLGEGVAETISDVKALGRNQSMVFEGYLNVPTSGKYTFYTRTAGGCKLKIDETLVTYAPDFEREEKFSSDIYLEQGRHTIRFDFGHERETGLFHLKWSGPGFSKERIKSEALALRP